jgi:hypothetical protein
MARATARTRTDTHLPPEDLKAAFDVAMAFPVEEAETLRLPPDALIEKANEEAAFGRITVDPEGLTTGTRLHIIEPARLLLARWRHVRRQFDVAIEPNLHDIRAAERVEQEIADARERAARDERDAEEKLEASQRYVRARNDFRVAEARHQRLKADHENRNANLGAFNPLYWVALLCIGLAEWLINYDVFLLFAGVVAVAAGATIVMGVLLAFAAHGHGLLFKQWSYRFGEHREALDRHGDWRLLSLASFSLLIVLGAAAGSRYAAVMHQLAGQPAVNILGSDAQVAVDPLRDVLLSLLWNVMAWAVGVFIAYMAHDKDPDFMDAARQYDRSHRLYEQLRRPFVRRSHQISARLTREIERLETAARTRAAHVAAERALLQQVEAHESALVNALTAVVRGNVQTYRANLAQLAASQRGAVTIERTGLGAQPLSISEFRDAPASVTPEMIRGLA